MHVSKTASSNIIDYFLAVSYSSNKVIVSCRKGIRKMDSLTNSTPIEIAEVPGVEINFRRTYSVDFNMESDLQKVTATVSYSINICVILMYCCRCTINKRSFVVLNVFVAVVFNKDFWKLNFFWIYICWFLNMWV